MAEVWRIAIAVAACAMLAFGASAQKQDVEIAAPDGVKLKATYYSPGKPGPGVMLFHMCNRDRSSWETLAPQLVAKGLHVLAWDYRGYGQSGGEQVPRMPLEQVVKVWSDVWGRDMRAVNDWFVAQPGVDQSRLAAAGGSCGVFMSLLYAGTFAPQVKAAVIMAGPSDSGLREFVGRADWLAVLGASSREEAGPTQMIQEVVSASKNPQSKMLTLEGAGHGTDMLSRDKEFSGTVVNWIAERLAIPATPVAVNKPTLTYMASRKFAVLFGGFPRRGRAVGETWILQNNCWRKVEIPGPPARGAHGAAYDERRKRLVIFGGGGGDGKPLGDTWEFDGVKWEQKHAAGPEARVILRLAYDRQRKRVVLVGGSPGAGQNPTFFSDTWEWDGKVWRKAEGGPPARAEHTLAFDTRRKELVTFGGWVPREGKPFRLGDTWRRKGAEWTEASAGGGPPARDHHALAFHESRAVTVLFAGSAGTFLGDTWTWDGKAWTEQSAKGAPSARGGTPAMTYDRHRKKIVMYGGWDSSGPQRDLWEWDGTWTRVQADTVACAVPATK